MSYIDREKLIKEICKDKCGCVDEDCAMQERCYECNMIENAPTEDVAPIKHGKWIYIDGDLGYGDFQCSNCNEIECIDDDRENYKYCPNCGAKMDLESGE